NLDQRTIYELVDEVGPPKSGTQAVGVFVDDVTEPIANAFLRLMRTLANDNDRKVLAPLFAREIVYYLMKSRFAHVIYQLGIKGSQTQRVFNSIKKIRRDF